MDSEDTAEMFLQPMLTHDFIRNFDNTSIIKPNNYPTIAEFVPTSFGLNSKEELVTVESANSLQPGNITTVQCIKPPEKWAINQTTAHFILHLQTRTSASSLIRMGTLKINTTAVRIKLKYNYRQTIWEDFNKTLKEN